QSWTCSHGSGTGEDDERETRIAPALGAAAAFGNESGQALHSQLLFSTARVAPWRPTLDYHGRGAGGGLCAQVQAGVWRANVGCRLLQRRDDLYPLIARAEGRRL